MWRRDKQNNSDVHCCFDGRSVGEHGLRCGTTLCQQTTGRSNSCNPRIRPNRRPLFVHLTRRGPQLMTDLGAEDLWHIGNTRRTQFTAHYLARSPLRIFLHRRYPPSSPPCVLSHLLFLFSGSYISTVARFPLSLFFCFSLLLFRTPILLFLLFLFIFIPVFSGFFLSLSFLFVLAFYYLVLFLTHHYFYFSLILFKILSSRFLLTLIILLIFISFILILSFCFRLHVYLQRT